MKKERNIRIIIHMLVWALILGLPVFSAKRFQMGSNFLVTYYTFTTISALVFYINYLFLIPLFFFQKKKHRYYLAAFALILLLYFVSDFANEQVFMYMSKKGDSEQLTRQPGEEQHMRPPTPEIRRPRLMDRGIIIILPYAHLIGYLSSSIFMVILSLVLRVLERQSKIEKIQDETEKAKLNAELALLKNQISPHFFFNTLNNIYSLIGRNNEDSKNAVVKLSRMMRYVLNASGQEIKPLSEEIEFMNNYIDLMKLRLSSKTRLTVNFPSEYEDHMVPHLLFISLIENAFKYGISVQEESFINLVLESGKNEISLKCENSLPASNQGTFLTESSGIGLENLKKRLNLLFAGRNVLKINRNESKFEVTLILQM